jgi:translation initiation factor 2 alpha subunit (eIF-2alpha)
LHISQLAPIEVKATRDVVREDETHLLRIISIDSRRQRIGLSLKAVTVREQMDWMAEQQEAEESVDEADAAEVEAFLNHTEVTEEE